MPAWSKRGPRGPGTAPRLWRGQQRCLVPDHLCHHPRQSLGSLELLLADDAVGEVMVNGPDQVWVERDGALVRVPLSLDADAIERIVQRVVRPLGLRFDRSSPLVDARLPDGSRVHAVRPPVAVDGPYLTIRRFRHRALDLPAFTSDPTGARLLEWMLAAGWNLLISGGTSSGKTTLLNTLASGIPAGERVVTIEETAELRFERAHVVRLEARPPNSEGAGAVTVGDLVRAALRMRPDRIVVGEVRGAEAFDLIEALNTGHDGSLSTVHANNPRSALLRLEALALRASVDLPVRSVRAHIDQCVDAIVHVERGPFGERRLRLIAEVSGEAAGDGPLDVRTLWDVAAGRIAPPSRPTRRPCPSPPP